MFIDRKISQGDTITFGNWPQSRDGEVMPIEWIVLSAYGTKAWLVTKHIIDCASFDGYYISSLSISSPYSQTRDIRWKNSNIRSWLNGTFLNKAFRPEEQELLAVQTLHCGWYGKRNTSDWNDRTEDMVALLRCEDVEYDLKRLGVADCTPTPYAVRRGASEESHVWWLREQGMPEYRTAIVINGIISQGGANSGREYGIRPAIELKIPEYEH